MDRPNAPLRPAQAVVSFIDAHPGLARKGNWAHVCMKIGGLARLLAVRMSFSSWSAGGRRSGWLVSRLPPSGWFPRIRLPIDASIADQPPCTPVSGQGHTRAWAGISPNGSPLVARSWSMFRAPQWTGWRELSRGSGPKHRPSSRSPNTRSSHPPRWLQTLRN